jgi:hypothetical protein
MKMQDISDYLSVSTLVKILATLAAIGARYRLGMYVGRMVLQSQTLVPQGSGRPRLSPSQNNHESPGFKYLNIITSDKISVDTVEIIPDVRSAATPHIVKFNGNSMTYHDHLQSMIDAANDMGAVMIAFDYPNVGNSDPIRLYSQQPLVNAGIAQVQRLLDQGVDPDKITLDGSSLGGAIAALVAEHFYPSIQLHLINDRSFSSVTAVLASMIGTQNLNLLIKPTLYLVGWEVNAARAFNKLPENKKMLIFSKHDGTIKEAASLYAAVKDVVSHEMVYEIANGQELDPVHRVHRNLLRDKSGELATNKVKNFVLRNSKL